MLTFLNPWYITMGRGYSDNAPVELNVVDTSRIVIFLTLLMPACSVPILAMHNGEALGDLARITPTSEPCVSDVQEDAHGRVRLSSP